MKTIKVFLIKPFIAAVMDKEFTENGMPLMASGCNRGNRIMNNQIIDEFDKASLIKEIHERDIIICNYQNVVFG